MIVVVVVVVAIVFGAFNKGCKEWIVVVSLEPIAFIGRDLLLEHFLGGGGGGGGGAGRREREEVAGGVFLF